MQGLKLSLIGMAVVITGGSFVVSTEYILFEPVGGAVACFLGLIIMAVGYRRKD